MLISNIKLKDDRLIGEVRLNNWNTFFENEEKTIELNIGGEICLKNILLNYKLDTIYEKSPIPKMAVYG